MLRPCLWLLLSVVLVAEDRVPAKKPLTLEGLASYKPPAPLAAVWSPKGKEFVYEEDGKLFLYRTDSRKAREIAEMKTLESAAKKPPEPKRFEWQNRRVAEQPIQWMPDGKEILLSVNGDLFLLNPSNRKWSQITSTSVAERDPKPSPNGKHIAYRVDHDLYALELSTKAITRLTLDGSDNLLNGELDWVYPEELELGTAYWWSPDSNKIAYLQFDTSRIGIYPQTDLTEVTAFGEPQKYPKAGTPNADVRLGIIGRVGGKTSWIDLGDPRSYLIARVDWAPWDGVLFVQKLNRVQNRLDLLEIGSSGAEVKTLFTETDDAWINVADDLSFLGNRQQFVWSSERTGFRHLYLFGKDGRQVRQLTSGEWEVTGVSGVDENSGKVFYVSTEKSPLERQLYAVALDSGEKIALAENSGTHAISMSPVSDFYLDTFSSAREPGRTTLHRIDGSETSVVRQPVAPDFDLLPSEIVPVSTGDGATLYGRLLRPAGFDSSRKYPAVVIVYGGPHAQMIRNSFVLPNWEQILAQKGFVVWALDNRGSAGRGHAWEAKLYRRFGKQELQDQKAGVEHLLKLGFVDPKRIGMYGWSYGGYMTLYSLLNEPDLFAAGIAGAPVVDWRNYDTIYTERYLGLPQENEAAYRESSAITYAGNLKAPLLLIHNYGDDNVLFQNTFQMANALQKADKAFEMMIYPQKAHGVSGPARNHLNRTMIEFFERTLKN